MKNRRMKIWLIVGLMLMTLGVAYGEALRIYDPISGTQKPVTALNPLPVTATGGAVGPLTNVSGTITAGGISQTLAAASNSRHYLSIQNPSTNGESLWVRYDGNAATTASPSWEIMPGAERTFEGGFVPGGTITITSATTGTAYTAGTG